MLMAYFDRIKSTTLARKAMGSPGPMTNHDIPPLSGNSNVGYALYGTDSSDATEAVVDRVLLFVLFCRKRQALLETNHIG